MNRDAIVTKANILIQKGRYDLTATEQRILLFLISKINPFKSELEPIVFTVAEFFKVAGLEYNGSNYVDCKRILKELADKSFWIDVPGQTYLCRWIADVELNQGSTITVELHKRLAPYLVQMRRDFTSYELIFTLRFKSRYSIRFYEYLKSVKFNNLDSHFEHYMSIDDVKDVLGYKYKEYRDAKQRCVLPALKEINEQSDLMVKLSERKSGRRITAIVLDISVKGAIERMQLYDAINAELDIKAGELPGQQIMDAMKGDM